MSAGCWFTFSFPFLLTSDAVFKKSFRNPKWMGKKKNKAIRVFNFFADSCTIKEDSDLTRSDFSRLIGKR